MKRQERLEIFGDKMKKLNNVEVNNFGDDISEDELKDIFEPFGKLISVNVCTLINVTEDFGKDGFYLCLKMNNSEFSTTTLFYDSVW